MLGFSALMAAIIAGSLSAISLFSSTLERLSDDALFLGVILSLPHVL